MLFPLSRYVFQHFSGLVTQLLASLGRSSLLLIDCVKVSRQQPARCLRHILDQAATISVNTLSMGLLMTTCFGMVIALQVAKQMVQQGAGSFVGSLVALAIVRELGPIMTGFSAVAIAGSAFTAELCTMRLTQQIDALQMLRISPIRYLVLPRLVAMIIVLPLVNLLTMIGGIVGGWIVSLYYLSSTTYFDAVHNQTTVSDLAISSLKASIFGLLIALICLEVGLSAKGGSREIGHMTTRAVVWSFLALAIADYLLTTLFYA